MDSMEVETTPRPSSLIPQPSVKAPSQALISRARKAAITTLSIQGARTHNLKNISLEFPRNKLIVITGVSGSGKSSLAFDTIYAEGQRRYVESLSSYARQFLERMQKPDVDSIRGITPAIAIEQRTAPRNPRSTVGTTTEVYDYLRLLFARLGKAYCVKCGNLVRKDTVATVTEQILALPDGTRIYVLFPLHAHEKRTLKEELDNLKSQGYSRVVVKGTAEVIDLATKSIDAPKEEVRVMIDRLVVHNDEAFISRLAGSVETAFSEAEGKCEIMLADTGEELRFSNAFECANDGIPYIEPEPRLFSFNSPFGACAECQGFGRAVGIDLDLVIPDPRKSIRQGAVHPFTTPKHSTHWRALVRIAHEMNIPLDEPYSSLTAEQKAIVLNGHDDYIGVIGFFKMLDDKSYKIHYRVLASRYRGYTTCPKCNGARLRGAATCVRFAGKNIHDVVRMTISEANEFFKEIVLDEFDTVVAGRVITEIRKRLKYLHDVGIGYLTLERLANSLSGGETQRINLATALGSALVGATYVLDEPSVGLHPRDTQRLIDTMISLRNLGNTVIVVEHDREIMEAADILVDIGPGAGEHGGHVVAIGTPAEVRDNPASLTGQYLSGTKDIPRISIRRVVEDAPLLIQNAYEHNLRNIDVSIPLHSFVCITGVSGSGKSTLVHDVLYANLKRAKEGFTGTVGKCGGVLNGESIKHVEMVDQTPIGRTPRSNPISYIHVFDLIRDLFAATPSAAMRGWKPGYFSFNVPGGRCESCQGDGVQKIEMQFLADLYLVCDSCKGKRYKKEVLEVTWRTKSIVDVLEMTVKEAIAFFHGQRRILVRLQVLEDVGLGYIRLGQPATTLSGGEAQRIKLASYLAGEFSEHTLFIFDEPTTGLHFDDIANLVKCFNALIDKGHSLIVIEHNMDVVKCADHVIDLGPGAGAEGGTIVAKGTPEHVARSKESFTAQWLRGALKRSQP